MNLARLSKQFDRKNMYGLLKEFPRQCRSACALPLQFPDGRSFSKICYCGMGGSALGGDIIAVLAQRDSTAAFFVHRDYGLPALVDKKTLVLLVSYSGNTEEVLSAYRQAGGQAGRRWVLTSGGTLLDWAKRDRVDFVRIPSGFPPRCALGYLLFPAFRLMQNLGVISRPELSGRLFGVLEQNVARCANMEDMVRNPAVRLALKLEGKIPILYSDTGLFPVATRWKTQLAENSKLYAGINVFPEMNHNEIMAWTFPRWFARETLPIFLVPTECHPRVQLRFQVTRRIIAKRQPEVITLKARGRTLLESMLNLIILGDWVSYYRALLNRVDPTEIKEINLLKNALTRRKTR